MSPACIDNTPLSITDCSTETLIGLNSCILNEVITVDGSQQWVYHYDGTNYSQIEYFEKYSDTMKQLWVMDLEYDALNRVSQTSQKQNNYTHEMIFNYTDQPYLVISFSVLDSQGNRDFFYSYDVSYYHADKDSIYEFSFPGKPKAFLMEFEAGNLTKFYNRDSQSSCELLGYNWRIFKRYYDTRPNIFKNYAVLQSSGYADQFWLMLNDNNLIGGVSSNDRDAIDFYCSEFLTNGNGNYWIKKFFNRIYYYDCDN